jgi:hypothetical protein
MKWTKRLVTLMAVSVLLGSVFAAAAEELAPGKVGSKAEIWLPVKTRFSGFALPAGQYLLEHRRDGSNHIMAFVQLRAGDSSSSPSTHKRMPVMVRCRLEPLQAKAPQTAFYSVAEGDANRAIKLEIRGETVAHVFPMPATVGFTQ